MIGREAGEGEMCMGFDEAQNFVMRLGQHKGRTLFDIAGDDEGLKYLDWLVGQKWVDGELRNALESYLKDPAITAEVDRVVGD